jgi:hypothetical protein
MEDVFGALECDQGRGEIEQIDILETDILAMRPDPMVDDRHLVSGLDQNIHHMGTDETASASNCDSSHRSGLF